MAFTEVSNAPSIGVEITNGALFAVVIDKDGSVVHRKSEKFGPIGSSVEPMIAAIKSLRAESPEASSVGIAIPGLVDRRNRRVAFSANIPKHTESDLVEEIAQATGIRPILENDANSAAYAEYCVGAGRGSENLFYATLGDGVGGAFIIGGEIWRGASGYAGEFGYVPINSEGTRLEDVASSTNIIRRTRSRFHQDNTSSLNRLGEEGITLDDIVAAALQDDDFAQMMLQRTGVYVGTAIASVINLLNVEKIVIGGEIMQAKHLVLDAIVERARELSFAPSFSSTSIVEGELGPHAAAIGAAIISSGND